MANNYNIYLVTKEGHYELLDRISCVENYKEAARSYFRHKREVFYHANWIEENEFYCDKTKAIIPVIATISQYNMLKRLQLAQIYMNSYDNVSKCDCGSEAIYGKSDAHSAWCSIKTRR